MRIENINDTTYLKINLVVGVSQISVAQIHCFISKLSVVKKKNQTTHPMHLRATKSCDHNFDQGNADFIQSLHQL